MQRIWELPAGLDPAPPGLDATARASVAAASARLHGDLLALRERHPPAGALLLTGHAHLDLAWLWPLAETRRKAQRTFSTALGLLERFPELTFNQSSAQAYAFVEEDDPALFARVQAAAADGRWEPIGGMWVEPDLNAPCGESLVRQLLYGQRYFARAFGAIHTVCWLPDCFGFTPALPQLLRGAGIERFFTIKLTWSETNAFPHDLFWWEGLDGSRVLAHLFDNPHGGYNGRLGPAARGRDLAPLPRQGAAPREPAQRRLRRRRRRGHRGDGRAGARARGLPRAPRAALRAGGRLLRRRRRRARGRRGRRPGVGRRALPRAAPRHADQPGADQAPAPAGRARAGRRRGRGRAGPSAGRAGAAVARGAVAGAAAQPVPRHPAGLEHPGGLRGGRGGARLRRRRCRRRDRRAARRAGRAPARARRRAGAAGGQPRPARPAGAGRARRVVPGRSGPRGGRLRADRARHRGRPGGPDGVRPRRGRRRAVGVRARARERAGQGRARRTGDAGLGLGQARRAGGARRARQSAVGLRGQAARVGRLGPRGRLRGRRRGAAAAHGRPRRRARAPPRRGATRAALPRLGRRAGGAPVGRLGPPGVPHDARLARPAVAAQGPLPARGPRAERVVRDARSASSSARRTATPRGTPRASRSRAIASPTSPSRATASRCSTTAATGTTRAARSSGSPCCAPRRGRTRWPTRASRPSPTPCCRTRAGWWRAAW